VIKTLRQPARLRKVLQGLYESYVNILIVPRETYNFQVIQQFEKLPVGFVEGC
jgi:hypothetical protein